MGKLRRTWLPHAVLISFLAGVLAIEVFPQHPSAAVESRPDIVWPNPPARPAIRYVATLPDADAARHRGSWLRSLGRLVSANQPAGMVRPLGVAADHGVLYVTDPGGHALVIHDAEKNSVTKITKAEKTSLRSPVGVAIGKQQIYVCDSSLKQILVYDLRGRFLRTFAAAGLERPTGIALDEPSGKLYVADTAAHRILIYRLDGQFEKSFGRRGTGKGEFNYPTHLWLDQEGSIFVVDSLNYRVQVFRPDGAFVGSFGHQGDASGDFASPKGIATDTYGHVYVVDALFDSVQIFDRQGQLLLAFGGRGGGPGQFWLPAGIFIDHQNRIYIADSYNQRVQVFEFVGGPEHGD